MKNEENKYTVLLEQYERSARRFSEAVKKISAEGLSEDERVFFRDSVVKRFEISFDLAWKTLREKLRSAYGMSANSPKKVFQEAFKQKLIDNDAYWLTLTDTRNETTHAYNEAFAEKLVADVPAMAAAFLHLLEQLRMS